MIAFPNNKFEYLDFLKNSSENRQVSSYLIT
jgi:hypothetical protein